jgi:hypothetical protein
MSIEAAFLIKKGQNTEGVPFKTQSRLDVNRSGFFDEKKVKILRGYPLKHKAVSMSIEAVFL